MNKNIIWYITLLLTAIYLTSCSTEESSEISSGSVTNITTGEALLVDNYNGWDEIRTSTDGSTFFNKFSDSSQLESSMFMLNNDSIGFIYGYAKFDENEFPQFVMFNGVSILIENYYDTYLDASVIVGDSVIFYLDSLNLGYDIKSQIGTRASKTGNWIRTLSNVSKVVMGGGSVIGGATVILSSGIGTALTGGGGAVAAAPAFLAGVALIGMGVNSINDGLDNLIIKRYDDREVNSSIDNYIASSAGESLCENLSDGIAKESLNGSFALNHLPKDLKKMLGNKVSKSNIVSILASLTFSTMDQIWGETYTVESELRDKYNNCKLLTKKGTNITKTSAILNGYINKEAVQGNQTRYGFIVRSKSDNITTKPIDNGTGEAFSIDCTKLTEATNYKYMAYFWDYSNGYIKFAKRRILRTLGVPVNINNVGKNSSMRKENGTITYDLNVNIELKDNDDDISDWGFYYLEGKEHKSYSLKDKGKGIYNYNFKYVSNLSKVTLKIGSYIKYKSENDNIRYSEPTTFTFSHDDNYGITIEGLKITNATHVGGTVNFDVELTVNNNIKDLNGVLSYGYYIAYRPFYPGTYVRYQHYKSSTNGENTVVRHINIPVSKNMFDEVDKNNCIATCYKYSLGTYVRLQDSTYINLEEHDMPLVYSQKPKLRFSNAKITGIETLPYNEDEEQYYTKSEYTIETEGSFWIDNGQINIWSKSGNWHWTDTGLTSNVFTPIKDGKDTLTNNSHYYEDSEKEFYVYVTLNLKDGSSQSSDNSLHYYGDPLITNVSISNINFDAYTRKDNNLSKRNNKTIKGRKKNPTISLIQ